MDLIDNEKSKKELRFDKYETENNKKLGSAGSSDTTDELLSWHQPIHESERQKKYLVYSNKNF
jgi:hypothetical protein